MAKKNIALDLTKLTAGSYFQNQTTKARLLFTGVEFYLQTTKPNVSDPEAFLSWLDKDFVAEHIDWFKDFEPRLYSENERTWFLSREPKLAKIDQTNLSFSEGRILATSESNDPRLQRVIALNLTRLVASEDLTTQVKKLTPEQKAELIKALSEDNKEENISSKTE